MGDEEVTYSQKERRRELYNLVADRVNQEISVYWMRNNVMLVVNAGILMVAFAKDIHLPLALGLFTIGVLCSVIWMLVAVRSRRWLYYWENRLVDQEEKLPKPHVFPAHGEGRKDREKEGEPPPVTNLILSLPIIFIAVWGIYIVLTFFT